MGRCARPRKPPCATIAHPSRLAYTHIIMVPSWSHLLSTTASAARQLGKQLIVLRQTGLNSLLSLLYGAKVEVLPAGSANIAAALVLFTYNEGQRQFVLVRTPNGADPFARFVSCLGLQGHSSLPQALWHALNNQLGELAGNTIPLKSLQALRVAATPIFRYTDPRTDIPAPVQTLIWLKEIPMTVVEAMAAPAGSEILLIPEIGLYQAKVSPTHQAMWSSVKHLLKPVKAFKQLDDEPRTTRTETAKPRPRLLH
jgi:hypothetical protein